MATNFKSSHEIWLQSEYPLLLPSKLLTWKYSIVRASEIGRGCTFSAWFLRTGTVHTILIRSRTNKLVQRCRIIGHTKLLIAFQRIVTLVNIWRDEQKMFYQQCWAIGWTYDTRFGTCWRFSGCSKNLYPSCIILGFGTSLNFNEIYCCIEMAIRIWAKDKILFCNMSVDANSSKNIAETRTSITQYKLIKRKMQFLYAARPE